MNSSLFTIARIDCKYILYVIYIYVSLAQTYLMKYIKLMFVLTIQKKPRITNWVLCNLNQREPGRFKTGYCVLKANILQQKTRNLKRHVENKHKGVRYPFSQCEFAANTARVLKKHVKNKHEGLGYFFFSVSLLHPH